MRWILTLCTWLCLHLRLKMLSNPVSSLSFTKNGPSGFLHKLVTITKLIFHLLPSCPKNKNKTKQKKTWTQPPCCVQLQKFNNRTPGLFKLEFKGDGIIALCSKTYYCFGKTSDKLSCKALNKRHNDLSKNSYQQVLQTQISGSGVNKSFRTDGKTMYTYKQQRDAFSFFYIKRLVQQDGISTQPLLI